MKVEFFRLYKFSPNGYSIDVYEAGQIADVSEDCAATAIADGAAKLYKEKVTSAQVESETPPRAEETVISKENKQSEKQTQPATAKKG